MFRLSKCIKLNLYKKNNQKNVCAYPTYIFIWLYHFHNFIDHFLSCLMPDALAVCRVHRGLPVGFLLLRYPVLFTVESLSLLYLLFIS